MTMALPSQTEAMTRMGAKALGRMWRTTMRQRVAPAAYAASMKVFCLMDRTVPRTTREAPGAMTRPMTRMMLVRLCPSTDTTANARTMPGSAIMVSTARCNTWSTPPFPIARDQAEERAEERANGHRREAHNQRDARAIHNATQHVAPQGIRATQELGIGGMQTDGETTLVEIEFIGILRGQHGRQDGD